MVQGVELVDLVGPAAGQREEVTGRSDHGQGLVGVAGMFHAPEQPLCARQGRSGDFGDGPVYQHELTARGQLGQPFVQVSRLQDTAVGLGQAEPGQGRQQLAQCPSHS